MALYAGRLVLIKVDVNAVGGSGASWTTIGQQRDGGCERGTETVDGKTKADVGWPNDVIVGVSWSVSCDGVLDPADGAWVHLKTKWKAMSKVWIQIDRSAISGTKEEGQAIVKISEKFSNSDLVSFTAEFTGQGQLSVSP